MTQSNREVAPRLDIIQTIANQIQNSKWAIWKAEPRENGDMGKNPKAWRNGKLTPAPHNDVTQWGEYTEALEWFKASAGQASGLGLLVGSHPTEKDIAKGNPGIKYFGSITALDIDKCLDENLELKRSVSSDVKQVIRLIQSEGIYLEVSPSNIGLRSLWFGKKPPSIGETWKNCGTTGELYDGFSTRFVTITGEVWKDSPTSIIEVDDEFTADIAEYLGMEDKTKAKTQTSLARNLKPLTDTEIVAKLKQMKQGKVRALFNGEMGEYANDHSAADAALTAFIAKCTDDLTQVVRVWGLSALADRSKFKEDRGGYQNRTAQFALDGARAAALTSTSKETLTKAKLETALKAGDASGLLAEYIASVGGKIPASLGGCDRILSLDSRFAGAFVWDEFSHQTLKLRSLHDCFGDVVPQDKQPYVGQTWSDRDTASVTVWLENVWNLRLKPLQVSQAVNLSAQRFAINTVCDALTALIWDGVSRLDSMLIKYFKADDKIDTPRYLKAIGRAWMIATVARAFEPGCKHDNVLVLGGGQGMGKSRSVRSLACSIAPHAFKEGLPPLGQSSEPERSMQGVWICEMPELASVSRASTEMVKSFLSKQFDSYRLPYGERYGNMGRTASFIGSTNSEQYIKDIAGRRFWAVTVARPIDIKALEADAKQLWAEAVVAYKAGESWYLTDPVALRDAERSQKGRLETGAFDELIAEKIIDPLLEGKLGDIVSFRMQALQLWALATGGSDPLELQRHGKSFADALTRSGFVGKRSGGKSIWTIGNDLAAQIRQASQ